MLRTMSSHLYRDIAGSDLDLNSTMGMILIGLIVDTILYGIMFFQTYLYFTSSTRDRTCLRAVVAVLWTLNTLQLALLSHTTYYFLVLCFGEPDELAVSVWSLNFEIAPSVIATFMVRSFFTFRLWHLSQGNSVLICTIMAFAFPQLGIGLGMCVASFQKNKFSELPRYMVRCRRTFFGLMTAQMSAAATADILITASLLYYLKQSKMFGTRRTNSLINRLIVWTVNTALLTGVVETAQVISWVSATNTLIFLPFHLILAKLYTCSMLAMLNGRRRLRKSFDEPHTLSVQRSPIEITLHDDGPVLSETGPVT